MGSLILSNVVIDFFDVDGRIMTEIIAIDEDEVDNVAVIDSFIDDVAFTDEHLDNVVIRNFFTEGVESFHGFLEVSGTTSLREKDHRDIAFFSEFR